LLPAEIPFISINEKRGMKSTIREDKEGAIKIRSQALLGN
jgi:hypothetical protein